MLTDLEHDQTNTNNNRKEVVKMFLLFLLFGLVFGYPLFIGFLYLIYKADGGKKNLVQYFKMMI